MVNVYDVVKFILCHQKPIPVMKLHKLVYYCQAWSLVWDDKPLFRETIEAWVNGPVVRDLYACHRLRYAISSISHGNVRELSDTQKETISAVLHYYGDKSSQWLSDLTHMEDPWKKAREGLAENERGRKVITHASMAEYYSSLPPNCN